MTVMAVASNGLKYGNFPNGRCGHEKKGKTIALQCLHSMVLIKKGLTMFRVSRFHAKAIQTRQVRDRYRAAIEPRLLHMQKQDEDQLHSNCAADRRICFRHIDSTSPLLPKCLVIFCNCSARFVSDLVGNPEVRFSCAAALLKNNLLDSWMTPATGWKNKGFTVIWAPTVLQSI